MLWDSPSPQAALPVPVDGDASNAGTDPGPTNYGFDVPDPDDVASRRSTPWAAGSGGRAPPAWIARVSFRERRRVSPTTSISRCGTSRESRERRPARTWRCACALHFHKKFLLVDDIWGRTTDGGFPHRAAASTHRRIRRWTRGMRMCSRRCGTYSRRLMRPITSALFGEGDASDQLFPRDMDYADLFGRVSDAHLVLRPTPGSSMPAHHGPFRGLGPLHWCGWQSDSSCATKVR